MVSISVKSYGETKKKHEAKADQDKRIGDWV